MADIERAILIRGGKVKGRKLNTLGKYVAVVPKQKKEVSDGGIVLPEQAQRPEITGILLAVGEEVPDSFKERVKEGDVVVYPQHAGTSITLEDDKGEEIEILFMPYDRLVGTIEEIVE